MTLTIGYWKIRGLRTPITWCLEYGGIEYKEELHEMEMGEDGQWHKNKWFNEIKPNLPLTFPNLPYLYDESNNLKMTQMVPIMAYICNKHKILLPQTLEETARTDMMNGVAGDFRGGFVRMSYGDGDTEAYIKSASVLEYFRNFDKYLANDNFCSGTQTLTYADFNLYEILDHHRVVYGDNLFAAEYPNVDKFLRKIDALEQVKNYRASDRWFTHPLNNYMAKVK